MKSSVTLLVLAGFHSELGYHRSMEVLLVSPLSSVHSFSFLSNKSVQMSTSGIAKLAWLDLKTMAERRCVAVYTASNSSLGKRRLDSVRLELYNRTRRLNMGVCVWEGCNGKRYLAPRPYGKYCVNSPRDLGTDGDAAGKREGERGEASPAVAPTDWHCPKREVLVRV